MVKFIGITEDNQVAQFELIDEKEQDKIKKFLQMHSFYPISDDAYELLLNENFAKLNADTISEKMSSFNLLKEDILANFDNYVYSKEEEKQTTSKGDKIIKTIFYCDIDDVIGIEDVIVGKEYFLDGVIENRIRKNKLICEQMIKTGIVYNNKHYSYKIEDQVNYEDKMRLINQGILTNETGVLIKADGEAEYESVSVEEFTTLYKKLLYNKYYNLYYMTILNKYISTFTDVNAVERLTYEVYLPEEYRLELKELLKPYKEYRDAEED